MRRRLTLTVLVTLGSSMACRPPHPQRDVGDCSTCVEEMYRWTYAEAGCVDTTDSRCLDVRVGAFEICADRRIVFVREGGRVSDVAIYERDLDRWAHFAGTRLDPGAMCILTRDPSQALPDAAGVVRRGTGSPAWLLDVDQ